MSERLVVLDFDRNVAVITLDHPATLNALTQGMLEQLSAALTAAAQNARAVLLRAQGRGFCSGANLSTITSSTGGESLDVGAIIESHLNPMLHQVRALDIPIVCAIRGAAAGAGASLALTCDIILASETAYFLQAFRKVGLVPDGGAASVLTKAIGRIRAMELMLLAEKLGAAKALEWGLITRVYPDEALDSAALEMAADLAAGPSFALGRTRHLCWEASETPWENMLLRERDEQRGAGQRPDAIEGMTSFLEKRPARFTGR